MALKRNAVLAGALMAALSSDAGFEEQNGGNLEPINPRVEHVTSVRVSTNRQLAAVVKPPTTTDIVSAVPAVDVNKYYENVVDSYNVRAEELRRKYPDTPAAGFDLRKLKVVYNHDGSLHFEYDPENLVFEADLKVIEGEFYLELPYGFKVKFTGDLNNLDKILSAVWESLAVNGKVVQSKLLDEDGRLVTKISREEIKKEERPDLMVDNLLFLLKNGDILYIVVESSDE